MRTRFLATGCSTTAAPLETLDFVPLPLPHLPPPNYPPFSATFDEIPVFGISLEIDKLPIDDSLSIFFSDVLPHLVDGAGIEEPIIDSNKEKHEEKDQTKSSTKGGDGPVCFQFEIPEMDTSLHQPKKSGFNSQVGFFDYLSEVPEAELTMDLLSSELTPNDPTEFQESLYSVANIKVEYPMEQKGDLLDDVDPVQGKKFKFPVFEVDMESLGILGRKKMIDELLSIENIEKKMMQPDGVISNEKELLGSMESDWINYLFHHSVAILCLDHTCFSSQLDFISIIELSHCQEYSALHCNSDGYLYRSADPILFDEYMFLDLDPYHFSELLSDSSKKIEAETCENMFGEAMSFKSFSQLIVSHELTLMDDSFKSLPIPIFSDEGSTSSILTLIEELLAQFDWQSSSASDGLYLDWHFLGGDDCGSSKYSSSWKMLWELDTYNTDVNVNASDSGKLIFDFILSEGHNSKPNAENCDENLNLSRNDDSIFHSSFKADSSDLKNHGDGERISDDVFLKTSVKNVSVLGKSMSSDLEFFLNPRYHIIEREYTPAVKPVDTNTVCQVLMSNDDSAAANATTMVQQKWNVKMHKVQLSDNILLFIDYLWKNFLDILGSDKELVGVHNQYKASNDLKFLYLPMEKFRHHLHERIATGTYVVHNNDDIMAIAMLCAIKHMAFYLCYYGIQAAYLYMDKLSTSLECIKSRFSFLYNLIRDENEKVEKELSINHPSISVVKEILQTIFSHSSSKVLVVSDQVYWCPLKRLLASLKISCKELDHPFTPTCQQHQREIVGATTDITLYSDCCLVSHEHVSPSFPFNKFSFILEHGGSNVSSRISSICPQSNELPTVYFLKVEVGQSSIAEALSHGVNLPMSHNPEMTGNMDSASAQKECKTKLEELLNTIPVMETYGNEPAEAVNEGEDCNMVPIQSSMPEGLEQTLSCKTFGNNIVIIVNTRNFNEEMVISRRSTYQKILEMEQEGAQVVERDIGLPVDLIVSPSVCLTWYDCRNFGKKASAPDEAFSCLPLCVESVAASILTSLSFAFCCCILIFEGECNFLCSIMESSDEIYAAAASLGIDIQLFCSYSHEMTEEIILSCINVAAKLTRGVYPKMSDSESLAEYFLTAFSSVNPLSAHAILSSDAILGKFLELSNEGKSCALQKYQVPDESIALLSVLCRYGEREDSRSGLTDCSSSLSITDSEYVQFKLASEKKSKYTHKRYGSGQPTNDFFRMDSQKLIPEDQHDLPEFSVSCNAWLPGSTELSRSEEFSLFFDDKLPRHTHNINGDMMKAYDADIMKSIDKSSIPDFPLAESLQISNERENPWMHQSDVDSPRRKSATTLQSNFSRRSIKAPGILQGSSTGEIIDLKDTPAFRETNFVANSSSFSPILLDDEKDYTATNSRLQKRPSGAANLSIFMNPTDISAASGTWVSKNYKRKILSEEVTPYFDTVTRNNMSIMRRKRFVEEDIIEEVPRYSHSQCSQEKGTQSFGGTQLSNALHSTQPQGSPWTIEFLNRIREKSRLRKQSVSYDLSSSFGSSGSTSMVTKRKSPSILEFYKYEGGSTPHKIIEEKRLKRISQPLNSLKTKKASASCPSSTPVDKRARRRLSFTTNGSGGQSKLVWRDSNYQTSQRRL